MRKGTNPAKHQDNKVKTDHFHQVIVPVYLPNLEGYYKEGLDILKLCLESIALTTHDKTYISVVNNGSCLEVEAYLNQLLQDHKIHEVIHTTAIGKINAIAKGLAGHNFDLVTITDADVLFTNGWQKAVYDIYENFPKAGMVGTTPNRLGAKYLTENIYLNYLFKKNKIKIVKSPREEDIIFFYKSIEKSFNKLDYYIYIIKEDNLKATIGAGHFCATYRKKSLLGFKKFGKTNLKMGGKIMNSYIDKHIFSLNLWRLSTFYNYTYHLGNNKEQWMAEKFKEIHNELSEIKEPILNNVNIRILDFIRFNFLKNKYLKTLIYKIHKIE
ncbi:glycosyltransferase family A protein [Psychroflexus sp. MBR-150]|jgi:hypothetical protein